MSILKSTHAGKYTILTVEYMLSHGWHHPSLGDLNGTGIPVTSYGSIIRDNGKPGKFNIVIPTRETPGKPYLRCLLLCPIQGCTTHRYRVLVQPKTIKDLDLVLKLLDCGDYSFEANVYKKYKMWKCIDDLVHSDFCEYEVVHK